MSHSYKRCYFAMGGFIVFVNYRMKNTQPLGMTYLCQAVCLFLFIADVMIRWQSCFTVRRSYASVVYYAIVVRLSARLSVCLSVTHRSAA